MTYLWKHIRSILTVPFFLAAPLGVVQAQQSPSWVPPASQPSQYDSQHQNVLEIAPAQQPEGRQSSLQASLSDDPWYRHQADNFDDPYYQQRRAREQEVQIAQSETSAQSGYAYRDQYEYDPSAQAVGTSIPRPLPPSRPTVSQAPSTLWDLARVVTFVAGYQSGLVGYDSCRRQYYFTGVPVR